MLGGVGEKEKLAVSGSSPSGLDGGEEASLVDVVVEAINRRGAKVEDGNATEIAEELVLLRNKAATSGEGKRGGGTRRNEGAEFGTLHFVAC